MALASTHLLYASMATTMAVFPLEVYFNPVIQSIDIKVNGPFYTLVGYGYGIS